MRNAVTSLKRHRHASSLFRCSHLCPSVLSTTLHNDRSIDAFLYKDISSRRWRIIDNEERQDAMPSLYLFQRNHFSTGFTSVHGEKPSAEYAKLRRESLESKFGNVLGAHRSKSASVVYRFGPFLALYRAVIISFHLLKLTIWQFFVHDTKRRSIKFRETLIHLGPFYIKLGQALSTRPDILPTMYCQELAKLQDQIPPFPTHIAIKTIESQLGVPVSQVFADITPEPIASASLGQVYKVLQLTCILESW